jgi:hypothetical protein
MKKLSNPKGVVIYEGISLLDNITPVVVIATFESKNEKTGNMVQTWILRSDMPPHEAVKRGDDKAICGDCKYASGNGCYVTTYRAPLSIYKAYKRGNYPSVGVLGASGMVQDRKVRIGAYGDPACVPFFVWSGLLKGHTSGHTGYTHQWKKYPQLKKYVMASVDNAKEALEAIKLGFRVFAVHKGTSYMNALTVTCPASKEAGKKSSCITCTACNGVGDGERSKRAHVEIAMH